MLTLRTRSARSKTGLQLVYTQSKRQFESDRADHLEVPLWANRPSRHLLTVKIASSNLASGTKCCGVVGGTGILRRSFKPEHAGSNPVNATKFRGCGPKAGHSRRKRGNE